MGRFKLVDLYDGYDLVGYADDVSGLMKMINSYNRDCDGECWLCVYEWDEELKKYIRKEDE